MITRQEAANRIREQYKNFKGFKTSELDDDFLIEEYLKFAPDKQKEFYTNVEKKSMLESGYRYGKKIDDPSVNRQETISDIASFIPLLIVIILLLVLIKTFFYKNKSKHKSIEKEEIGNVGRETKISETHNKKENKNSTLQVVLAILSFLIPFLLMKSLGLAALLFVLPYFIYLLANKFSAWYIKNKTSEKTLTSILVWSNVVTWMLPPLGLFTGISALNISDHEKDSSKKYIILGVVGILLSVVNSIFGAM